MLLSPLDWTRRGTCNEYNAHIQNEVRHKKIKTIPQWDGSQFAIVDDFILQRPAPKAQPNAEWKQFSFRHPAPAKIYVCVCVTMVFECLREHVMLHIHGHWRQAPQAQMSGYLFVFCASHSDLVCSNLQLPLYLHKIQCVHSSNSAIMSFCDGVKMSNCCLLIQFDSFCAPVEIDTLYPMTACTEYV